MRDRIVQHPNRYKLTPVSGTADTYDLEAVPGEVTEAGTPLNKATLLTDATTAALGLSGDPTVDDALGKLQGNIKAVELLYSKIRDIPDAGGTAISIDVSDIDWDKYAQIRMICKITKSVSSDACYMRANNISASYFTSKFGAGSSTITGNTSDAGFLAQSTGGRPLGFLDITFRYRSDGYQYIKASGGYDDNTGPAQFLSYLNSTQASFSSINIVSTSSVSLTGCSLWGMKK